MLTRYPGIIDQDVEPAELLADLCCCFSDGLLVCYV